jgi:hypothetical protein
VKLPQNIQSSEIQYLEKEFRKQFHFGSNVHVTVVFQRYDSDWNEYIDLDEEAVLNEKDKLKVVVSPTITTPSPSSAAAVIIDEDEMEGSITPRRIVKPMRLKFDDEVIIDNTVENEFDSTSTPFLVHTTSETSGKAKVKKDEDDRVPLPSPFPLPKHYPYNVESALNSKKMTKDVMSKFISVIAGTMLTYKRYPTSEDYYNVAQSVITKYPHLRSPAG